MNHCIPIATKYKRKWRQSPPLGGDPRSWRDSGSGRCRLGHLCSRPVSAERERTCHRATEEAEPGKSPRDSGVGGSGQDTPPPHPQSSALGSRTPGTFPLEKQLLFHRLLLQRLPGRGAAWKGSMEPRARQGEQRECAMEHSFAVRSEFLGLHRAFSNVPWKGWGGHLGRVLRAKAQGQRLPKQVSPF